MEISITYVGNDLHYWGKIQSRYKSDYEGYIFSFSHIEVDENFSAVDTFIQIYQSNVQILYLDLTVKIKMGISLAKLLNRNNETRLLSLVGLVGVNEKDQDLLKAINASIRINHVKCDEFQDVIYDPMSLIDVNIAEMPEYVRSGEIDKFEIFQPLRVGYIENNRFHIETNSYLKIEEIVEVDQHPLDNIMPSKKVYVEKFYDKNLYYNKRFAYDLEFIFIDNDFFVATNENWKLYKKFKEDETVLDNLKEIEKEDILADIEERKKVFEPTIKAIEDWMELNKNNVFPKRLKVMVVDDSLEIIKGLKGEIESFPYSLNFQTKLMGNLYQLERTLPHLLILNESEKNSEEEYKNVLMKIKEIKDYNPSILYVGASKSSEELRRVFDYKSILAAGKEIDLDLVTQFAKKLDEKLELSDAGEKVFFRYHDKESTMFLKRSVKVVSMTESVLYFQSEVEIPMWTVFKVKKPVLMYLTVVPHKENGKFSSMENCYRCLINGVGELEKAEIRRLINSTLADDSKDS